MQAGTVKSGLALAPHRQMNGLLLSTSGNPTNAQSPSACHSFLFSRPRSLVKRPGRVPDLSIEPLCPLLAVPHPSPPSILQVNTFNCPIGEALIFSGHKRFVYGQLEIILKVTLRHENRPPQSRILKRDSDCFYSRPREHLCSYCLNILFHHPNPFALGLWVKAPEAQLVNSHPAFGQVFI